MMANALKNNLNKLRMALLDVLIINLVLICGRIFHPSFDSPLAMVIQASLLWDYYRTFAPITVVIRFFFLFFFGLYELDEEAPAYKSIQKIFQATTLSTIIIFTIIHGLRNYYFVDIGLSRYSSFIEWSLNILLLFGWRFLFFYLLPKVFKTKAKHKNTLIIGTDEENFQSLSQLSKIPFQHWKVIGYLSLPEGKKTSSHFGQTSQPCLDHLDNFLEVINLHAIENVILASQDIPQEKLDKLIGQCHALNIKVFILPRLYEIFAGKVKLLPMESLPIFEIIWEPISTFNRLTKRLFDLLFALAAIILSFPLMLIISLLVKLTSKGPVLFKQIRIGKDNQPFMIYKFRTMVENAEKLSGPVWASHDDPRVTPVGRFLRKTSLDELPQLFQVLLGKLSLVGPRPERPHFVNKYKDFQGLRLCIKPGLTGLAQINGRYEADLSQKIHNDIYYINNYSFYLDLAIVAKTIWAVLTGQGAR